MSEQPQKEFAIDNKLDEAARAIYMASALNNVETLESLFEGLDAKKKEVLLERPYVKKDRHEGLNAVHVAAIKNHGAALKSLFGSLNFEQIKRLLNQKVTMGEWATQQLTPIMAAMRYFKKAPTFGKETKPQALNAILDCMSEDEWLAFVLGESREKIYLDEREKIYCRNPLCVAAWNNRPDALNVMWEKLGPKQKLDAREVIELLEKMVRNSPKHFSDECIAAVKKIHAELMSIPASAASAEKPRELKQKREVPQTALQPTDAKQSDMSLPDSLVDGLAQVGVRSVSDSCTGVSGLLESFGLTGERERSHLKRKGPDNPSEVQEQGAGKAPKVL